MRIDRLDLRNFKKFERQTFNLHPQFTLLVGDNGSGKTSVLDALSVALGVWLLDVPDSDIKINSRRPIDRSEIRLEPTQKGDRTLFREAWSGVEVTAQGTLAEGKQSTWSFERPIGKMKTSNQGAKSARDIIRSIFQKSESDTPVTLPVLGYYGAGRAWLPHNPRRKPRGDLSRPAKRWAAFYDCLNERIRMADLADWFQVEAIAAVNRQGRFRPGFEIVRRAVLACVPGGDGMWYDGDRKEVVLSINKQAQPFGNLSAGQRMMLALAADIAIKMVIQNNYLVPPDVLDADELSANTLLRWKRSQRQSTKVDAR